MKVGGQILWNAIPICETSQIYYLMGRRPMKDVLGSHLKDRLFHVVHWFSICACVPLLPVACAWLGLVRLLLARCCVLASACAPARSRPVPRFLVFLVFSIVSLGSDFSGF